jgi:hypothetical protein
MMYIEVVDALSALFFVFWLICLVISSSRITITFFFRFLLVKTKVWRTTASGRWESIRSLFRVFLGVFFY